MKLYSYWRSTASYRVRLALALKGLEADIVPVDLVKGDQSRDAFLSVNPVGMIPALDVGEGAVLTESQAILDYLETAFPDRPLMPQDPVARAKCLSFGAVIACNIHPLGNLATQKYVVGSYGLDKAEGPKFAAHWMTNRFPALETIAAARDTSFLFGEDPGYAECFLTPQFYSARRFGVDLAAFPALADIDARVTALPEVQSAIPENQPDAPTS